MVQRVVVVARARPAPVIIQGPKAVKARLDQKSEDKKNVSIERYHTLKTALHWLIFSYFLLGIEFMNWLMDEESGRILHYSSPLLLLTAIFIRVKSFRETGSEENPLPGKWLVAMLSPLAAVVIEFTPIEDQMRGILVGFFEAVFLVLSIIFWCQEMYDSEWDFARTVMNVIWISLSSAVIAMIVVEVFSPFKFGGIWGFGTALICLFLFIAEVWLECTKLFQWKRVHDRNLAKRQ